MIFETIFERLRKTIKIIYTIYFEFNNGKKIKGLKSKNLKPFILWLRGKDLNLRPSGYEPDELPTAPPRDVIYLVPETGIEPVRSVKTAGF